LNILENNGAGEVILYSQNIVIGTYG